MLTKTNLTNNEHELLTNSFKHNFSEFKNKNIVLYGLGIKTQAVLSEIKFNFIGLMDREPHNIGKTFFSLKVLSYEEAIESADLIIILSEAVHFQTIFSRIEFLQKEHNIPIYFCDGTKAQSYELDYNIKQNPYWNKNIDELKSEIDKHEVISFDIFDTLITRKLIDPANLWKIIGQNIGCEEEFFIDRVQAGINLGRCANLKEIYAELEKNKKISYKLEESFDSKKIIPRKDIIEIFHYALKQGKKIYLISDMYYKKKYLQKLLKKFNIKGYSDILISCEIGKSKYDKDLWEHYSNIIKDKKALHIGDNIVDDIKNAEFFGINTYHILTPYEILKNSTLKNIVPKICSIEESIIVGNIISKIFNSPFSISKSKGQPVFNCLENLGYVFFAPILFTYITWIIQENIKNKTDKILFVARDGYFLEKLYKLTVKKLKIKNAPKAEYLMGSRQLALIVNFKDEHDIDEALKTRFQGTMKDYFKVRFGINIENEEIINLPNDYNKIREIAYNNKAEIFENSKNQRKYYLKYLHKIVGKNESIAIVDPSYNGTNQYFLSKLLNKKLKGYYCNALLSEYNPYFSDNNMFALFQSKEDKNANNSNLRKNIEFFEEGILVAPTGTCLKINKNLTFEFAPLGNTQKQFHTKQKIFKGVLTFFTDTIENYNDINHIEISPNFVDFMVGEIYGKNTILTEEIKETFYSDTMHETVLDKKLFG